MGIDKKIKFPIIVILVLLLIQFSVQAQKTSIIERIGDDPVTYNDLRLSEKGRWLLSRINQGENSDTILLFDTKNPTKIYFKLIKMNVKQEFIGEKYLFAQGLEHVDLIRLDDLKKISYPDVRRSDILTEDNSYVILDKKNVLTWYNNKNEIIKEVSNVDSYVTDEKKAVIIITKQGLHYAIINLQNGVSKEIYTGTDRLSFVPLFKVGRFSAVTETETSTQKVRGMLIDTKTSALQIPIKSFMDVDFLKFTEIQNGTCYLMESEKKEAIENSFVEVRYSNDPYLRFRKRGVSTNEFWLINTVDKTVEVLPTNKFSDYIAIGNPRFLLALNKEEKYNYRFAQPIFTFYLYDRLTKLSTKIEDGVRNVEVSLNGRFISMRNELTGDWLVLDTESLAKKYLGKDLRNPMFYSKESMLVFESDNGLRTYNLMEKKFTQTLLPGLQTFITRESNSLFQRLQLIIRSTADEINEGIVIKGWDKNKNATSYFRLKGKHIEEIIPETEKLVKHFKMDLPAGRFAYTIEESYNQKPNIFQHIIGKDKRQCMTCNEKEEVKLDIRQEIISYKNSLGKALKGILYYPVGFESAKKYPMVVKIYQEQSAAASQYITNHDTGDAFNPGLLLKHGYFVFLPDIVMDERGSGLAALDCVNSALDALQGIPHINQQRIGLTGHSFGGFETNFIATHSTRFKAYFSGSGTSHLTEHYFTNNANYGFNEYARIETGQYDMRLPFATDKKRYWENNPIYYAEKITAPILLWAGLKDTNVLPSQAMAFYTALIRNGKDAVVVFYANQGHILEPKSDAIRDMNAKAMDWWNYFLKDKKDIPWIDKQMQHAFNGL